MADERVNFIIAAQDRASGTVRKLKGELGGMGTAANKSVGPMSKLSAATGGLVTPTRLAVAGTVAATAAFGALAAGLAGAISELIDIERLNAQTAAAIRSTGGAAKVTLGDIEKLSEGLERTTTTERQVVQEGANLLLTFTKVRNEVGRGNDIFDQATKSALDLSVAMGMDMRSASLMLGKALNDPVRGITALTRAGVQLTDQQKQQIKAFVAAGDTLSAQKVILAELSTQVGGSAKAYAKTTAGMVQRFQNDVGNMFESIIVGAVKVGDSFSDLMRQTKQDFGDIGDFLGTELVTWEGLFGTSVDSVKTQTDRMALETQANALAAVRAVEAELVKGGPVIALEAGKVAGLLPHQIRARDQEIRNAGLNNVASFALGILDAQDQVKLAMVTLGRLQEEEMTKTERIAYLKGLATDIAAAQGLNDGRHGVSLAADAVAGLVVAELDSLGVDATNWGINIGRSFSYGINSQYGVVKDAAGNLADAVRGQIAIRSEPPDADSPLRGITKWGGNIVKTVADDIRSELDRARAAAGALGAALVPTFGVRAPAYATAGGAVNMTIQVNAPLGTPAAGQAMARELAPELVRELRRQGKI